MGLQRTAGVAAEAVDGLGHLHGLGDPLHRPGLGLHQRHQIVGLAGEDVGQRGQQLAAVLRGGAAPRRERVGCGPGGVGGLVDRHLGRPAHHRFGRRVDDVVGAPSAGRPVAAHEDCVVVAHGRKTRTCSNSGQAGHRRVGGAYPAGGTISTSQAKPRTRPNRPSRVISVACSASASAT